MKFITGIILVFIFYLFEGPSVFAQRVQGGIIGGINISQVDGDEVFGFNKFGFNTGLTAITPIYKNIYFGIETTYSQKGAHQKKQYSDSDSLGNPLNGSYDLHLNYLEVPFLILYNDKDVITAGGGFSYGRLISLSEYEHGRKVESTTLTSGPYSKNDFSILADIRFSAYKKFKVNIRYTYSLAKIRTREFIDLRGISEVREQYNNVISLRFIYMFNENPIPASSKKNSTNF